jgi:hypothetical protein
MRRLSRLLTISDAESKIWPFGLALGLCVGAFVAVTLHNDLGHCRLGQAFLLGAILSLYKGIFR